MVRGSYVKGTSFVEINSSESEDDVMKDVKERLTCPRLGTLSPLLIFLCKPGRAGFVEKTKKFFLSFVLSFFLFFSGCQHKSFYYLFVGKLGTAGSFFEPHACAVKCRPPRLFQQGKILF